MGGASADFLFYQISRNTHTHTHIYIYIYTHTAICILSKLNSLLYVHLIFFFLLSWQDCVNCVSFLFFYCFSSLTSTLARTLHRHPLYSLYMLQCQLQHPLHRQQSFHLSLFRLQILTFHLLQHKALLLLED